MMTLPRGMKDGGGRQCEFITTASALGIKPSVGEGSRPGETGDNGDGCFALLSHVKEQKHHVVS